MASWKSSYSFQLLLLVLGWFIGLHGSKQWMKLAILFLLVLFPVVEFSIYKVNDKRFLLAPHPSHVQSNQGNSVFSNLRMLVSKVFNKTLKANKDEVLILGPFGNTSGGGQPFDYNGYDGVTEFLVRSGVVVDCIALRFTKDEMDEFQKAGGDGGTSNVVYLKAGEQITEVQGSYGTWQNKNTIVYISFGTSYGRKFGPYGAHPNFKTPNMIRELGHFHEKGRKLVGFFGEESDNLITSIGFYFLK